MMLPRYTILETSIGPVISESRVTVYDVLLAQQEGLLPMEISNTYNLSPLQVEVALAYIEEHRARLEPELVEIRRQAAEREAYYRALAAAREREWAKRPPTPQRLAFEAWRDEVRRRRAQESSGDGDRDPE
ncbi:MAG TPA: DUF433 domain-containing protein [Ardenticatenaceae bacterium]|nr:DUF433 domain-containing protein [Ardenticatenaceae bacterium]